MLEKSLLTEEEAERAMLIDRRDEAAEDAFQVRGEGAAIRPRLIILMIFDVCTTRRLYL